MSKQLQHRPTFKYKSNNLFSSNIHTRFSTRMTKLEISKVIVFIDTVSKNEIILSSYQIMSKVSHCPMIYCKKFTMVNADNLFIVYCGVRFCCIMWKLLCAWLLLPHAKHVIVSKWKTVKVLSLCCKQFFIFQRAKELKKYQVMQNLFFGLT